MVDCNQPDELNLDFTEIAHNEKRTLWVVILTAVMMVVEIAAGYVTGSMALLADGYHMASHAGALGIAYLVYKLARSERVRTQLTFGSGKLLPLGGYTSAIGLGIVACWMAFECIERFLHPIAIEFNEALLVAGIGLIVNIVSAFILSGGGSGGHSTHSHDTGPSHEHAHHGHSHGVDDHNHRGALAHVMADALTSVAAIAALLIGKFYSAVWLDPLVGIVGSIVILRWAYTLCKDTAWELLDGHAKGISLTDIRKKIEASGHRVLDLHLWKVGPGNYSGQLVVESQSLKGAEHFRKLIGALPGTTHLVVEERLLK